jgi:hypothetical protein
VQFIARTVGRTPEVMVKMLNRGGQGLGAVARHFKYLDRDGELAIETDQGERLKGEGAPGALIDDWDLELEAKRPTTADLKPRQKGKPPKLVHKILFSMPAGTPPDKVLAAAKNFAREEFGAKRRYAMVLHTDEPHPHVHMVVKARGYDGKRLNIRRATLREWRWEFARHLQAQGVAANATERAVRGNSRSWKLDGIYRAEQRGESCHTRERAVAVAADLVKGRLRVDPGKARLLETRKEVERGWWAISDILIAQGRVDLSTQVRRFVAQMRPPSTDREAIAEALSRTARKGRDGPAATR